jgi:hypothetical protein
LLLHQAEGFNGDISKPQEEAVASEIFAVAANAGHQVLKKLAQGGKSCNPADYVRGLKSHYVDDTDAQAAGAQDPYAFNWIALGNSIPGWFRPVPCSFHMLGPMDAVAKTKRAVAQRKKKEAIAEAVRPDDVDLGDGDAHQTDLTVNALFKVLLENEGCLMTDLTLNHHSFAQTVENLFALSVLVKERRVKVNDSLEGVRVFKAVRPVKKKKTDRGEVDGGGDEAAVGASAEKEDAERFQFVMTFNEEIWNEWKQVVESASTLMPHREYRQQHHAAPQKDEAMKGKKRKSGGDDARQSGQRRG